MRNSNDCTLAHVATVPFSLWTFLPGQTQFMKKQGFHVHAICSPGELLERLALRDQIPVHGLKLTKAITPLRDLLALVRLWRLLRIIRPCIVQAHTPKGGLLGTLASLLAGVRVRIYYLHGLRLMTANGFKRRLLRWTEKLSCCFATQVLCAGHALRDAVLAEGLCSPDKVKVLLSGSVNGVDALGTFNPARVQADGRERTRREFAIPHDALVIGFVGRLAYDKGLTELVQAWQTLRREFPTLHLLAVGPFEPENPLPPETEKKLSEDPRIHLTGMRTDLGRFYAAMDMFVLPSYREGLNMSLLEAGAMALPIVATRIPGCVDALEDGQTAILVPPRDALALTDAIRRYVVNAGLRAWHGQSGRRRVIAHFSQEAVWHATYEEYLRLLRGTGLPLPRKRPQTIDKAA